MVLIIYVIYRVGAFLWKIIFITASNAQQQQRQYQRTQPQARKKAPNSNLNIDYSPKDGNDPKAKDYKGGDYVDYEEVKE